MSRVHDMPPAMEAFQAGAGQMENWVGTTIQSLAESAQDYARENPLSFAAWAFGIGFVLGWKLKPW